MALNLGEGGGFNTQVRHPSQEGEDYVLRIYDPETGEDEILIEVKEDEIGLRIGLALAGIVTYTAEVPEKDIDVVQLEDLLDYVKHNQPDFTEEFANERRAGLRGLFPKSTWEK